LRAVVAVAFFTTFFAEEGVVTLAVAFTLAVGLAAVLGSAFALAAVVFFTAVFLTATFLTETAFLAAVFVAADFAEAVFLTGAVLRVAAAPVFFSTFFVGEEAALVVVFLGVARVAAFFTTVFFAVVAAFVPLVVRDDDARGFVARAGRTVVFFAAALLRVALVAVFFSVFAEARMLARVVFDVFVIFFAMIILRHISTDTATARVCCRFA
jgi:hypothetical protein